MCVCVLTRKSIMGQAATQQGTKCKSQASHLLTVLTPSLTPHPPPPLQPCCHTSQHPQVLDARYLPAHPSHVAHVITHSFPPPPFKPCHIVTSHPQVLDARDPAGCRCPDVERYVRSLDPNKRVILLLNKMGECVWGGAAVGGAGGHFLGLIFGGGDHT